MMLAQVCDLEAGDFGAAGDAHIYANHLEQVDRQLQRDPLPLPAMVLIRRSKTSLVSNIRISVLRGTARIQASKRLLRFRV